LKAAVNRQSLRSIQDCLVKFALQTLIGCRHQGDALKNHILSLLALQPGMTVIESAWVAASHLADPRSERTRARGRLIAKRPIRIISFHPNDFTSIQSGDWQEITGHHRYYGRSAMR
jgi:hypothetical protein